MAASKDPNVFLRHDFLPKIYVSSFPIVVILSLVTVCWFFGGFFIQKTRLMITESFIFFFLKAGDCEIKKIKCVGNKDGHYPKELRSFTFVTVCTLCWWKRFVQIVQKLHSTSDGILPSRETVQYGTSVHIVQYSQVRQRLWELRSSCTNCYVILILWGRQKECDKRLKQNTHSQIS